MNLYEATGAASIYTAPIVQLCVCRARSDVYDAACSCEVPYHAKCSTCSQTTSNKQRSPADSWGPKRTRTKGHTVPQIWVTKMPGNRSECTNTSLLMRMCPFVVSRSPLGLQLTGKAKQASAFIRENP